MELNKKIDELKDDLILNTQQILKIRSIEDEAKPGMPFGEDVDKALKNALDICENLGFKTVNMDGYLGYAEYGEGDDYIAVLGHLDVVPEGDGWIYPPYNAEIHNGRIYARGALDDKAPIIAAVYGLKAIKDLNLKLSKRVRIIFGTNEESGCGEMEYYDKREKPPVAGFTPDGQYPIIYAEKGITIFDVVMKLNNNCGNNIVIKYIKGGQRANMVPDYCEAAIDTKNKELAIKTIEEFVKATGFDIKVEDKDEFLLIKSYGISAHGSLPYLGKNAIMQMFRVIDILETGECDILSYIKFFNKYVGFECDGTSFGCSMEDKESGKLSFNVGTVSMKDGTVSMSLNLRYPVTGKYEDMINKFNERLKGTNIVVENIEHQKPLFFPADHKLIKSLQKVYKEQTGQEPELIAIGGGTYAKHMPNIVAFGPIFPGKPDLDHQANEYIEVDDLILNSKIYAHAIYELAK